MSIITVPTVFTLWPKLKLPHLVDLNLVKIPFEGECSLNRLGQVMQKVCGFSADHPSVSNHKMYSLIEGAIGPF